MSLKKSPLSKLADIKTSFAEIRVEVEKNKDYIRIERVLLQKSVGLFIFTPRTIL